MCPNCLSASNLYLRISNKYLLLVLLQFLILAGMIGYRHYWVATGEKIMLRGAPVDPRDWFRGDYVSLAYEISSLDLDQLAAQQTFGPREKVYVALQGEPDGTCSATGVFKAPPPGKKFIQGQVLWERKNSARWDVTLRDDLGNLRTLRPQWWSGAQTGGRITFCLDGRGRVLSFSKKDPRKKSPCGRGSAFTGAVETSSESRFRLLQVEYGIESFFVQEGRGREIEAGRAGRDVKAEAVLRSDGKAMLSALWVGEKVFR